MPNDLLASLKGLITPELVGNAASALGEPEPAVSKGVVAAFPVLLSGLAHRSSDSAFASTLYDLVRDPASDRGLLENAGSLLAPGATSSPMGALGGKLLSSLFGNNFNNLASALAGFAGVKPTSGSSILWFAAPLVLAQLGKAVRSGNLSLSSLAALLAGEKDAYAAELPGPLTRIETYLATSSSERPVAPPPPPPRPSPPEPKASVWRWLLPLLIALAMLWLLSRCLGGPQDTTSMAPAPAPAPEEMATEELPLANFYFDVDQFELPVAREGSLEAVIEYLMVNPTAVAAISGYHDPSGDEAHNAELAKQRAQTVKDAMMAAGVPESQIDMVKPIVTTGSGDMAEARRVEVSIRR